MVQVTSAKWVYLRRSVEVTTVGAGRRSLAAQRLRRRRERSYRPPASRLDIPQPSLVTGM